MSVLDRIERLRNVMEQQKIDCYIIPTDDYHHSEYVGDYFKFREYITGFTGSASQFLQRIKRDSGQMEDILFRQKLS